MDLILYESLSNKFWLVLSFYNCIKTNMYRQKVVVMLFSFVLKLN